MDNPDIPNNKQEWFYDSYNSNAGLLIRIKKEIASSETRHQKVKILDTYEFGKVLVLNNYMYQAEQGIELTEMLVHLPMNTNGAKKKVLLIGAGDGVSLSQLVKYKGIEKIDAVEIDKELNTLCKDKFFIDKKVFEDSRVNWFFEDGFEFVKNSKEKYDLILSAVSEIYKEDGTPGMAYSLYTEEFYKLASEHLNQNGIFLTDGTTMHYTSEGYRWWEYLDNIKKHFTIVKPFIFNSKRMPGGDFVLLYGSNNVDPVKDFEKNDEQIEYLYYNHDIHKSTFVLPEHMIKKMI